MGLPKALQQSFNNNLLAFILYQRLSTIGNCPFKITPIISYT
jgi:hypothetical protein